MKNILNYLSVVLLAVIAFACAEPDYPTPTPSISTLTSRLTVVHAANAIPKVKVKVDNRIVEKDTVRFDKAADGKFYNTITLNVPAGPNRLVSYANPENVNLFVDRYSATASTNNTAFIIKRVVNGAETVAVRRVADDLTLPDVGFAKVRFLNFGFNAGEVRLTTVGGTTTVFAARKYDEVSRSGTDFTRFSTIAAGTYNYEIRSVPGDVVLVSIPNLKLDSKGIYTIYLNGDSPTLSYTVIKH